MSFTTLYERQYITYIHGVHWRVMDKMFTCKKTKLNWKQMSNTGQWHRNEINIAGARRGPKDRNWKPEWLGAPGSWKGGLHRRNCPSPPARGFVGAL